MSGASVTNNGLEHLCKAGCMVYLTPIILNGRGGSFILVYFIQLDNNIGLRYFTPAQDISSGLRVYRRENA